VHLLVLLYNVDLVHKSAHCYALLTKRSRLSYLTRTPPTLTNV